MLFVVVSAIQVFLVLSAISGCRWLIKRWYETHSSISVWSKTQVSCWSFNDINHKVGDISTSGLGDGHIASSGCLNGRNQCLWTRLSQVCICSWKTTHISFLPRDAMHSAALARLWDCMSVRLFVRDVRYRDHIGWNSSKIISRPNSLRPTCLLTPTWAIWCNGNIPELGWNRGGVRSA